MAKIWNGREWKDEDLLVKYKKNTSIILDCQLAIENYEDHKGVVLQDIKDLNLSWKSLKANKDALTDLEMYNSSTKIVEDYMSLLNKLGEDNFIFYKDGTIEYRVK